LSLLTRTKNGQKSELSPIRAIFSLVLRSKSQMFSEGGEISWAAGGCACLFFSRHWRFSDKITSGHNQIGIAIFIGLNSRLVQFGYSGLCPARRLFKLKRRCGL